MTHHHDMTRPIHEYLMPIPIRGDRDVSPDWNEAGKTKIPDLSVGKGCPYYFPTPFCQDLHPVRRSDCHKKPGDVLP